MNKNLKLSQRKIGLIITRKTVVEVGRRTRIRIKISKNNSNNSRNLKSRRRRRRKKLRLNMTMICVTTLFLTLRKGFLKTGSNSMTLQSDPFSLESSRVSLEDQEGMLIF